MGRSTTSCFKIITCASDSVDRDDLQVSESKSSADKRGWSFRKRSARHRVLSNTVISEVPSSVNKESPESVSAHYQIQPKAGLPEKSSEMQWTVEMPQLSAPVNSKFLEPIAVAEVDTKLEIQLDESVVTVIQTAVRRFLAERELSKQKNIVMLQAAVRGHLVRRHAVGSLRCVQAIIKMQIFVRARRTRYSDVEFIDEEKQHVKPGKDNRTQKGGRKSGAKPDVAYTSIEKLLSNSFACRLLESSPNSKSMNIKCDPSRPDSAWEWMERWASVSPSGIEPSPKIEPSTELKDQETVKHPENQVDTACAAKEDSESTDFMFIAMPAAVPYLNSETEEAEVSSESDQNLANQKFEQPWPEFQDFTKSSENPHQPLDEPSDCSPQTELNNLSNKPELEEKQPKRSVKKVASEQHETEERKIVFGARKASNAAFIAAHSKFEEPTSTSNSVNSVNICNQENEVESREVTVSSSVDNSIKTRDTGLADYAVSYASKVVLGGSECGTELSITSTLDSPEQSEFGAVDGHEVIISKEEINNPKNATICIENEGRVDDPSIILHAESFKPEDRLEENASSMQIKLEHETVNQMYKSSPEASPRSRVNILDSQTTPSSQASTRSKKTRSEKSGSSQKRKSLSVGKRSPLPSNDSGVRSSLEQIPKDEKSGKRRNSFGSAKTDHVDQEPRDSSSSLSVPSYMQATESARAKAYANNSPRSSPDVQDKESYIKKRHSLPGANGRQGSPRIQRSTSLAQPSSKGTSGNNPTQEKKWQR
ncbi:IQ domain-containing protein/DUF4005 domain-containing protein [Heracleum sosnowskyi]|uniref:IQ domain-containing protein/DUF4005 domain-containing protein n=1 Tax=Heracleum sosnowskyi TaxID=360622 RepID=A0AAD8M615_9APIA|nr:IQ domain-containing protein/DUF4005 domain-containing protein [Heracleum sosnowskyi]